MLGAAIVHPDFKEVIPLPPEFIMKQDGVGSSQDGWNSFIEPNSKLNFFVKSGTETTYSGCNHGNVFEGEFQHVIQIFESDSVKTFINGLIVGAESSNNAIVYVISLLQSIYPINSWWV